MFTTDLPETFENVLSAHDAPKGVRSRHEELLSGGVHYDTERAECIGWGREARADRTIYRGLYRGRNGRYFRQCLEEKRAIRSSIGESASAGAFLGIAAFLLLFTTVLVPLLFVTDYVDGVLYLQLALGGYFTAAVGGPALGALYPLARIRLYSILDRPEPTTIESRGLEPLTHASIVADPQSIPERSLATRIRDQQPTWEVSSGRVTELPDGSYCYEHEGNASVFENRDALREALEANDDAELYREVFNDYEEA